MVEHTAENRGVAGSSPALAIIAFRKTEIRGSGFLSLNIPEAAWVGLGARLPCARVDFGPVSTEISRELWGGETSKAVANFPVSGEPIPVPVARWLGRIKAAAARANAVARTARRREGRADRRRRRCDRPRRARRPVPDRRLPDRLGHELEHERERGDRGARRRRRARERRRQHGPVLERRLPVGGPPGGARRGRARPAARAGDARRRSRRRRASSTTSSSRAGRT